MSGCWRGLLWVAWLAACRSDDALPPVVADPTAELVPAAWHGGDQVDYALTITTAERTERWKLEVRLLDPLPGETLLSVPLSIERAGDGGWLESPLLPVHVRVARMASGSRGRDARSEVPETFLRSGLARACAQEAECVPADEREDELAHAWERARAALDGLALAVSRNAALVEPLARALDLPSPLALLFRERPVLRFDLPPQTPEAIRTSSGLVLWSIRATLLVDDSPALDVVIVVRDLPDALESPVALGAGIHSLHGTSPSDPARTIALDLVDAHRGTGPAWVLPAADDLAGERR